MNVTESFFSLTPDHILDAVESIGHRSTGRCFALNSLENRVYEVELESGEKVVGKFYRPGRWTKEAILDEHIFLQDLVDSEIPAVAPTVLSNGSTLDQTKEGIFFAVFPKVAGRAPDELKPDELEQIGRFLARIHNTGAQKQADHRLRLTPTTYGTNNLKFLVDGGWLPLEIKREYEETVTKIVELSEPLFEGVPVQRLHGDCHLGNLLHNQTGFFFLDFDDMVVAPTVQDLWLVTPGNDDETLRSRTALLTGYRQMRDFDQQHLALIEPLRALRFIHFSTWIAKRWKDPSFPRAFPEFNTYRYWAAELEDLKKQLRFISSPSF